MKDDVLHAHGLKKTPIRSEILDIFQDHDFALSASDVISRLKVNNDRVTVYRALSSFEQHGIIHKASETGNGTKYALCGKTCPHEKHADHHAHFICDQCHKTYCMTDLVVPKIDLPDLVVTRVDYTIRGICKECQKKSLS